MTNQATLTFPDANQCDWGGPVRPRKQYQNVIQTSSPMEEPWTGIVGNKTYGHVVSGITGGYDVAANLYNW
jgi:hypothetical protein